MRKQGFTLVELLAGMGVFFAVMMGSVTLMLTGLKSFNKTSVDVDITNQNSNSMRRISETLRQATNIAILDSGKTITFYLPKLGAVDAVTGEKELIEPLVSDGILRRYTVDFTTRTLKEYPSGRTLIRNLANIDPQAGSSQYNQAYTPFQLTSIGSYRAVSINLITRQKIVSNDRYTRMKTTCVVRNAQ